jgi:predicted GNAT family N-acyltransferase
MTAVRRESRPLLDRIQVRAVESRADMNAVLSLRRQVFKVELGMIGESVEDVDDRRSVIAIALITLESGAAHPVGTGRLTLGAGRNGEGVLTWVATAARFRRLGVGEAVVRFLLGAADRAGSPPLILAAQAPAIDFYRRLGFIPNGQRYVVSGIDHLPMIRPAKA